MLTFGDIFLVEEYPYDSHHHICLHWVDGKVYCARIIGEDQFDDLEKALDILRENGFADDEHAAFCIVNLTTEGFEGKKAGTPSPPEKPEPQRQYTFVKTLDSDDKKALLEKILSMKGEDVFPKTLWDHINSLEL